jgi:hypothetical protein
MFKSFTNAIARSCESILEDKELLDALKAEKFDIAIAEYITFCPYAIYKKIGVKKYITGSATPISAAFGGLFGISSITELSYVPDFFKAFSQKMTFFERLNNVVAFILGNVVFVNSFRSPVMAVINKHYPDMKAEVNLNRSFYNL